MFKKIITLGGKTAVLTGLLLGVAGLSPGTAHAASGAYNASDVYGQRTGGNPDFTTSASGTSDHELDYPDGSVLDIVHHRLFVSDNANNRVLVFPLDSNNNATSHTAQYVLGQADFAGSDPHTTQAGLNQPYASLAYDAVNDRLFVPDAPNNRVIVYDLGGGITDGMNASHVLGQTNFTNTNFVTTQNGMNNPKSVAFDAANERLFVVDGDNNRVLVFDVTPGTITDGMNASHVIGQANFTSANQVTTQDGVWHPEAVVYNSSTHQLFVGDSFNRRVLVYNLSGGVTDGMNASYVLGEPNFTSNNSAQTISQSLLGTYQEGLGIDETRNILYVADDTNNRVLVFDLSGGITNGMDATMVLGQPDFTTGTSNTTQDGINDPEGSIAVDSANNRIYVPDSSNNRVLVYNFVHFTQPAGTVLASTAAGAFFTMTLDAPSSQGTLHFSITSGSLPPGLSLNATTGVISGIPTQSGTYTFEAAVDDNNGTAGTFPEDPSYTITVLGASTIGSTVGAPRTGDGAPRSLIPALASAVLVSAGLGLLFRRRLGRLST